MRKLDEEINSIRQKSLRCKQGQENFICSKEIFFKQIPRFFPVIFFIVIAILMKEGHEHTTSWSKSKNKASAQSQYPKNSGRKHGHINSLKNPLN